MALQSAEFKDSPKKTCIKSFPESTLRVILRKLLVTEVNKMSVESPLNFSTSKPMLSTITEVKPIQSINSEHYVNRPNLPDVSAASLYIIPTTFFTFWLMYLIISTDLLKFAKHKISIMKNLEQVPCKNCQYFTNNPYLRCAVNPTIALTSQAINCSDYCPLNK